MIGQSLRRVWGLVYRHIALYRHSWPRVVELMYWPVLEMLVWGFLGQALAQGAKGGMAHQAVALLLGGVLLWEVTVRSQIGLAFAFLEEMWSRNLGHLLVSPLRPAEMLGAQMVVSFLRACAGVLPAIQLAWLLHHFDLFALGWAVPLFWLALMAMGWAVAIAATALILRHGAGAEALAWSVIYGLVPFSCVFYPVETLPEVMRWIAFLVPASHVFEGLRGILAANAEGGAVLGVPWAQLGWALLLDAVWLAAAGLVFAGQLRGARRRGALLNIGE